MTRRSWCVPFLLILAADCSGGGSSAPDAGPAPDAPDAPDAGTPRAPSVVGGYFDNGIISGFARPWLKNTTSASSVTFECGGDASCANGTRICAHAVLEGSPTINLGPSYSEPTSTTPQAGLGLAVNQAPNPSAAPGPWSPVGDGLYVALTAAVSQQLIVELTSEESPSSGTSERWCTSQGTSSSPDLTVRWQDFTRCNASSVQTFSPTRPIRYVNLYFEPSATGTTEHDLCLLDVVPFGLPSETISCADWYRHAIPGTRNVLINNVWNAQLAKGAPYQQCLVKRSTQAGEQYGWTWSWPAVDVSSSYAAPEVVFGRKPWDGGVSTTPDLPKRLDTLQSLSLDYSIEIMAGQSYNLNATLWLTRTEAAPEAADPGNIVAEVMVRFNNPVGIGGGNIDDGRVTLGGVPFKVSHQDAHADASGGSTYTWKMVVYEILLPRLAYKFDLAMVVQDMLAKGLALPENGVQGVEFITEVSGHEGEVWLNRFEVAVQ
jgi:hypothetical protein